MELFIDRSDGPERLGSLWEAGRRGRERVVFEYDRDYLRSSDAFELEPHLPLIPGPQTPPSHRALFGFLEDIAPDRWGRRLIQHRASQRSDAEGGRRSLRELDYVLGVADHTRQGAVRVKLEPGGPFVAELDSGAVPPVLHLASILRASERFLEGRDRPADLDLLVRTGASLGGARPKASVVGEAGGLFIAKFPRTQDEWDVVRWEAVALSLASSAGVQVPAWELAVVDDRPVLLLERFDRSGERRIPFASAMTLLGAEEHDRRSYMDLADIVRQGGAAPKEDLRQLWRRMVFGIYISNIDNHLHNHGFLRNDSRGWRLAPAYDINPVPVDKEGEAMETGVTPWDPPVPSLELAANVAYYFEVGEEEVDGILEEIRSAVHGWREVARRLGIPKRDQEFIASAFRLADGARRNGPP